MERNTHRIEARIPEQAHDGLRGLAEHYGVTLSQIVRWAIWAYLADEADALAEQREEAIR